MSYVCLPGFYRPQLHREAFLKHSSAIKGHSVFGEGQTVIVSHPFCELSFDVTVLRRRVSEQLAVRRVDDGDSELDNVLLIVLSNHVVVFSNLAVESETVILNVLRL